MQWAVTEAVNELAVGTELMTFKITKKQNSVSRIHFHSRRDALLGIPASSVPSSPYWLWELLTLQPWSKWEIRVPVEKHVSMVMLTSGFPYVCVCLCVCDRNYKWVKKHITQTVSSGAKLKTEAKLKIWERTFKKEAIIFDYRSNVYDSWSVLHKHSQGRMPKSNFQ